MAVSTTGTTSYSHSTSWLYSGTTATTFAPGANLPLLSSISFLCTTTTEYLAGSPVSIAGTLTPTTFTALTTVPAGGTLPITYYCQYPLVEAAVTKGTTTTTTTTTTEASIPNTTTSSTTTSSVIPTSSISHTTIGIPTPTLRSRGGVSNGAAAGIGIGVGLVGILIGAIAAWLFTRHQYRRYRAVNAAIGDKPTPINPFPTSKLRPSNIVASKTNSLRPYLLDGAGDSELTAELSSVGFLIEQHVQTYYHQRPLINLPETLDGSLAHLGLAKSARETILGLTLDSKTRSVGIRYLLALSIFSSLSIRTSVARALVQWRRISAFLLHEKSQDRSTLPLPDTIKPQIDSLVNALNAFLAHLESGDRRSASSQRQHLEGVIVECAKFGYVLFSHPCEWQFTFKTNSTDKHGVVVMPGLEKLSNKEGDVYDTPQVVVRPVVFNLVGGRY